MKEHVLWYRDGQLEVHGLKWWTTGACSPNCRIAIFMGKTDAGAAPHRQQSMVLVPMDAPGGLPRGSRRCNAAHHADASLVRARRQQLTNPAGIAPRLTLGVLLHVLIGCKGVRI